MPAEQDQKEQWPRSAETPADGAKGRANPIWSSNPNHFACFDAG